MLVKKARYVFSNKISIIPCHNWVNFAKMKLLFPFSIIYVIIGCSHGKDRILVPKPEEGFYEQIFQKINNEWEGDENDPRFVEHKIHYCERLNWPLTCIQTLDEYKRQKGMTPQLLDQYVAYYLKHKEYSKLLHMIDQWVNPLETKASLIKAKILALSNLNNRKEALHLLTEYMTNKHAVEDLAFAASQSLLLRDTSFSTHYLSELYHAAPQHPLIYEHYGFILWDLGYVDSALSILEEYSISNTKDFEFHIKLSSIYEYMGKWELSRNKIKAFLNQDAVAFRFSNLFISEAKWDSAHYYVDLIIIRDSLHKEAWRKKATMYEQRGWLFKSLDHYKHLIYLFPRDTFAIKKVEEIQQKIAHTQR